MKRERGDRDRLGEPASKRRQTDLDHRTKTLRKWSVPESHANMPNVIRQEVRDFHQMAIHVSEPTKVRLVEAQCQDASGNIVTGQGASTQIEYCPSTFNKEHAHKVAPPLPSFSSMLFSSGSQEVLRERYDVREPTSFQAQALPLLFEQRDCIAKASPGYGKTFSLVLGTLLLTFQRVSQRLGRQSGPSQSTLLVHPSEAGAAALFDLTKSLARNLNRSDSSLLPRLALAMGSDREDQDQAADVIVGTPEQLSERALESCCLLAIDAVELITQGQELLVTTLMRNMDQEGQKVLFGQRLPSRPLLVEFSRNDEVQNRKQSGSKVVLVQNESWVDLRLSDALKKQSSSAIDSDSSDVEESDGRLQAPVVSVSLVDQEKMRRKLLSVIESHLAKPKTALYQRKPILVFARDSCEAADLYAFLKQNLRDVKKIECAGNYNQAKEIRDLDHKTVIVASDELVKVYFDLQAPVVPLIVNFNMASDLQTLLCRVAKSRRAFSQAHMARYGAYHQHVCFILPLTADPTNTLLTKSMLEDLMLYLKRVDVRAPEVLSELINLKSSRQMQCESCYAEAEHRNSCPFDCPQAIEQLIWTLNRQTD